MNLDNHPKRKLIDDVSIAEMRKMREDGMSNQEIADALGCHYATVTKHIGRQGFRSSNKTRKPQHTSEQWIPEETYISQHTAREEARAHRLIPTRYQGQVLEIHVDRDLQEVVLMANGELTLTMSELHGAMMDLMALSKEMTDNGIS